MNRAVSVGAQVCFFPEASDFIGLNHEDSMELTFSHEREVFINEFKEHVKSLKIHASVGFRKVGVHEPIMSKDLIANMCLWIDDQGNVVHKYQKLHLFSINSVDHQRMKESKYIEGGKGIVPPFKTPIGNVGLAICHDLRYPEMSIKLRNLGAESYVIAANQAGRHNETRESYGHSMIVDPWGIVLASCSSASREPSFCIADIDSSLVHKVRKELPLTRRNDVYPKI
ncbi:hypothetical protein T552_00170 [Pneumocystis carinii B80]|uniref:CN hydrolase domain-containing protein n=1 Tax=Pneumocystis carinii (strain B80) TaxID=1408658 RepID=A0A0W4ZT32_PNEC8|nr:hypothetical protein T552_00170 [Pneumocystis carinii B80]KTW31528.1 hypothetical protein T552_00170 [Pneumocystis carinii B80]